MASTVVIKYEMTGIPELYKALRDIDAKVARKVLKKAIGEAIKPVVKTAMELVPVETETLKKSLGKKIASYKSGLIVTGIAGPRYDKTPKKGKPAKPKKFAKTFTRGGKQVTRIPTFYAHLVEKGTRPHALGKGSRIARLTKRKVNVNQHGNMHPGSPAEPFMAPALEKNKGTVSLTIMKFMKAAIDAANKSGKGVT